MSGFVLKVVSEVDEMGLFHQLGYDNREREWLESTIALLSGMQKIGMGAYVDNGTVFGGWSTTDHGVATVQVHYRPPSLTIQQQRIETLIEVSVPCTSQRA
jgi:hypothetical protein